MLEESFGSVSILWVLSLYYRHATANNIELNQTIFTLALHNHPFVQSTLGEDYIGDGEGGCFKIVEHDEHLTVLQTITHVEHTDKSVTIQGGLGHKLVPPTHTDYTFTFTDVSPKHLQFQARIGKEGSAIHSDTYRRVIVTYASNSDEEFYGFGEQFSYGTMKGQKVPILVR